MDPPTDPAVTDQLRAVVTALPDEAAWALAGAGGRRRCELPAELVEVLGLAAAALAEGRPVTLSCHEPVLSTQEAADLLAYQERCHHADRGDAGAGSRTRLREEPGASA